MKLPCVLWDGAGTAIATRMAGAGTVVLINIAGDVLQQKTGVVQERYTVLESCPVRVAGMLYNGATSGIIRSRIYQKELTSILANAKFDISLKEHIMTAAKEVKGQPAAKKTATKANAKAPTGGKSSFIKDAVKAKVEAEKAPADKKPAAKGNAKAVEALKSAAKEAAAKAPAKTPAKAAKAPSAEGGGGRKGRPPSFDLEAKVKKGAQKLEGSVREGTVREALMKKILEFVGKPVKEALGAVVDENHTVKAVDVKFAVDQGYIAL
jgi:hypothetical protein